MTTSAHGGLIHGTPGRDVVRLLRPGTVYGGGGSDVICGSSGPDRIYAGGGRDTVLAGAGADLVRGGAGRDAIFGEGGDDRIAGGAHRDTIVLGDGRDRIVAERRAGAGRGEDALPDIVSGARNAISLLMDGPSVRQLLETGRSVGVTRPPAAGGDPNHVPVVWTTFFPLPSNVVTWPDDDYSVYIGGPQPLVPGVELETVLSAAAQPGSRLIADGNALYPDGADGVPGAVSLVNQSMQALTAGLAQAGTANGVTRSGPLDATTVFPDQLAALTPPTRIGVFAAVGIQPGRVLPAFTPPPGVAFSTASPTATFTYSAATGSFQAG